MAVQLLGSNGASLINTRMDRTIKEAMGRESYICAEIGDPFVNDEHSCSRDKSRPTPSHKGKVFAKDYARIS